MDGHGRQDRTGARTRELFRVAANSGPLTGHYLASQAGREWAMAAVRPTVGRPTTSGDRSAPSRWLGTLLVAVGQRLQGANRAAQAVGGPAAVEPGTAS